MRPPKKKQAAATNSKAKHRQGWHRGKQGRSKQRPYPLVMASGVARIANRQIGIPKGGCGLTSGAVGELVGAAEVLGYFWDAKEF